MTERRSPCPMCGSLIVEGARKCRSCKKWIGAPPASTFLPRAAFIMATAAASVLAVLISGREDPVGEAPPLTKLVGDTTTAASGAVQAPAPGAIGPEPEPEPENAPPDPSKPWHAREIRIGEVHPLDIAISASGTSVYVSADDATVREYTIKSGDLDFTMQG